MKKFFLRNIIILFLTLFLFSSLSLTSLACQTDVEKIIYLTFDDGPGGKITNKILDTLKEEGVPATFFVIGCQVQNQEDIILRMKNEGHSIGLHSVTHDRNKLYHGNEGFLKEMLNDQAILEKTTGQKYKILRFPFGCNNNTYKLTDSLVNLIHENDLRIYDWTQDTCDGANANSSPDCIFKKSISEKNNITLLMHCGYINKNSATALPSIIKHYKKEGYTFKAIDETTPEIYKVTKHNN
ncbi:polysaccharide deacetylase [Clostridium gasigenes]|uniref:polysaccharide deacetylase family protein n=1 Tax=Clostridium gasigenes TaxID=94869 RepID=UPI001C0C4DB7|nr:polysaccharide deacetylase [Clostridium gasigenes]